MVSKQTYKQSFTVTAATRCIERGTWGLACGWLSEWPYYTRVKLYVRHASGWMGSLFSRLLNALSLTSSMREAIYGR